MCLPLSKPVHLLFKFWQVGLKPGGFFILKENIAKNGMI